MPDISFTGLAVVAVVAFVVPLLLGLGPRIRLPAVVLEIVAGIIIGPGLDWVEPDLVVEILSLIGLAFLLFLAGLEIELERFRGRFLRLSALGLDLVRPCAGNLFRSRCRGAPQRRCRGVDAMVDSNVR